MKETGVFYNRIAYNTIQVLAFVGGLWKGVFFLLAVLSLIFRRIEAMAQVIEGFVHNKEEIEDAKKFNTFKFQAKFFFNTLL